MKLAEKLKKAGINPDTLPPIDRARYVHLDGVRGALYQVSGKPVFFRVGCKNVKWGETPI